MRGGHEGRGRQVGAFLAGAGRCMKHLGLHPRTATYHEKTTTTDGASQRSLMGNHRLQRGGPVGEHTDSKTTNTTIRKPRRYENPPASRPHTN